MNAPAPMVLALLTAGAALSGTGCGPTAVGAASEVEQLVVTQVPLTAPAAPTADRLHPAVRYPQGSRLVLVADRRQPEVIHLLSRGLDHAGAPDLSPDGRRVLFSGTQIESNRWTLFEAALGGRYPRPIRHTGLDCIDPAYIARERLVAACTQGTAKATWALYTMSLNGQDRRRLTYGPGAAFDPTPLADGRILFSMQQQDDDGQTLATTALFTINSDGTMLQAFSGNHRAPRWLTRPRQTTDGHVVYLRADAVDEEAVLEQVSMAWPDARGLFLSGPRILSAEPTREGTLVVAAAGERASAALILLSPDGSRTSGLWFDDPQYHDVEGLRVESTAPPPSRPSAVGAPGEPATLICYNTALTDRPELQTAGIPSRLQAEWLPEGADASRSRPLGDVSLAADGSFHVRVPADRPLRLAARWQSGLTATSHWFWLRPGEVRTCFGCHEGHGRAPANRRVLALDHDAQRLSQAANGTSGSAR